MKRIPRVALHLLFLLCLATASAAHPRQPLPPWPKIHLAAWHWDEALRQYPLGEAPDAIAETDLVSSWSGYALRRAGERVTAFVVPQVTVNNRLNFTSGTGAVRIWFKPAWGSTDADGREPGSYARLLEIVSLGNDQAAPVVQWSLYATPDGNALFASGQGQAGPRDYLHAAIQWPADSWHLVLLAYTTTNSALYLDGELAALGGLLPVPPATAALALVLGSDAAGTSPAQGDFDELTTFDTPPLAGNVALHYAAGAQRAAQGPITEEEYLATQARRAALAQQRAERAALSPGGGAQMLRLIGGTSECLTNVPVFITNVISVFVTNQGWTVTFDVQGGSRALLYDTFTASVLAGNSLTNAQWTWLERSPTCSTSLWATTPQPWWPTSASSFKPPTPTARPPKTRL